MKKIYIILFALDIVSTLTYASNKYFSLSLVSNEYWSTNTNYSRSSDF